MEDLHIQHVQKAQKHISQSLNIENNMNLCELAHFIYDDKSVSKYELHWKRNYNSKTFFISEQDYHDIMDSYSEKLLINRINIKYNNQANVCMTVTH